MMGSTTVAVITAALALAAHGSAAVRTGSAAHPSNARTAHEIPGRGRVSSISIAPGATGAEVTITIDSAISVNHFVIESPTRLVVDLGGASLALRNSAYDGVARGSIRNVRLSQYRADTVRLVIDLDASQLDASQLDASRRYTVARNGASLRLVVNGGSNIKVNQHLMTLDTTIARFQAFRGQSYGVDIVKLDGWGLRANGLVPPEPNKYNIYGVSVYAPYSGQVIAAVDGLQDMPVPQTDRQHMAGNHVLLRCKDADVLLGHFKPGSLKVRMDDAIAIGQAVGAVGNSGNTSEPHLHIHAQQRGTVTEPFSGNPLPMRFDGRFLVRNDRFISP